MIDAFDLLLHYPFLQRALLTALIVAVVASVVGVFVVLRGLSLLGDGLAHISLAGVAIGLVAGIYPLAMALVLAILGALAIHGLRAKGLARGDTAIGILFTTGLAGGIVILNKNDGLGVGLDSLLFGNLLSVGQDDLLLVGITAGILLATFALLHKEFVYITFNHEAARTAGLPVTMLDILFTVLTATTIVIASRIVGVLLVSALLIIPAATTLRFARTFRAALIGSIGVGLTSVLAGVMAATQWGLATGATIALSAAALFALGLVISAVSSARGG